MSEPSLTIYIVFALRWSHCGSNRTGRGVAGLLILRDAVAFVLVLTIVRLGKGGLGTKVFEVVDGIQSKIQNIISEVDFV